MITDNEYRWRVYTSDEWDKCKCDTTCGDDNDQVIVVVEGTAGEDNVELLLAITEYFAPEYIDQQPDSEDSLWKMVLAIIHAAFCLPILDDVHYRAMNCGPFVVVFCPWQTIVFARPPPHMRPGDPGLTTAIPVADVHKRQVNAIVEAHPEPDTVGDCGTERVAERYGANIDRRCRR